MIRVIFIVIGLLALAVAGLSVRIILERDGRFGSHDVGASPAMRERGISCSRSQDRQARRTNPNKINPDKL